MLPSRALRTVLPFALLVLSAAAQGGGGGGGGRGRSEAITNRVACFFVAGKVEAKGEAKAGDSADPLVAVAAVQEAIAAHIPVFIYLYDTKDNRKRESYEQIMFGGDEMGISLRPFRCVRIDVSDEPALQKYQSRVPVFAAYDRDGHPEGEVSQVGYKAAMNAVSVLLGKAAAGQVKPSLQTFVEGYRAVVRELEVNEARKKTARDRMSNLGEKDAARRAALEKDLKQLDADLKALEAREAELLKQAQVPPRPKDATRLGERKGR